MAILKRNSGTLLDFSEKPHLITFLCYPELLPYHVPTAVLLQHFVGSFIFWHKADVKWTIFQTYKKYFHVSSLGKK